MTTETLTLTTTRATVSSSRPDGMVDEDGLRWTVTDANGQLIAEGEAIPPEGNSIDCWAGSEALVLPRPLVDELHAVATDLREGSWPVECEIAS